MESREQGDLGSIVLTSYLRDVNWVVGRAGRDNVVAVGDGKKFGEVFTCSHAGGLIGKEPFSETVYCNSYTL